MKNCPYCYKSSGYHEPYFNQITDEMEYDECKACEGSGVCSPELLADYKLVHNDEHNENDDDLPF